MSSSKSGYVIDIEQPAETARLIEQSKLFTSAMGDLFPDELELSHVRRVLAPGGLLLLTEAERSISTSPALQRLEGWLTCALWEQERTFSVDGLTIGIVHMLKRLLEQAGFVEIEQRPFLLDASVGSPLYASSLREFEVTYALLQPYLVDSGVVDGTTYVHCYHWMLAETHQPDFRCLAFGVSAWGSKPQEEPADEGVEPIV